MGCSRPQSAVQGIWSTRGFELIPISCWAQVVSLHCNLSEDTYHLLNEDRLNMMKKDATLINCSRGPVIDEVALTNFLQANENFRCGALSC